MAKPESVLHIIHVYTPDQASKVYQLSAHYTHYNMHYNTSYITKYYKNYYHNNYWQYSQKIHQFAQVEELTMYLNQNTFIGELHLIGENSAYNIVNMLIVNTY